jgi:hypothetical protein
MGSTLCPRCGHKDSFLPDHLHNTCVCQVCESQLDWREIPGCGPDCRAAEASDLSGERGADGGSEARVADDGGESA